MTKNIMVLGGSGMLGSMVVSYLATVPNFKVTATTRSDELLAQYRQKLPQIAWKKFDADAADLSNALAVCDGHDWVINAIGITKPLIHDDNAFEVDRALRINALLPHRLAERAEANGSRVLQIATDCVYSGQQGFYVESDDHDALDVYGKTKSLGEAYYSNLHHLRCSIIGPEPKDHKFLLEWFLGQPPDGQVNGFTNHRWNGVTTLHFAKLCGGIITKDLTLSHLQHIVPDELVTKYQLLQAFAESYGRSDVTISPMEAKVVIDRTLSTKNTDTNQGLWAAAGYEHPPSVPEMVQELADFEFTLVGQSV